jgi:tRNA A37 threonylcarbamoyladenosine dehydratase
LGAGAKLDPSKVQISDISKSYNDNLAKILRKRLHRIGIRTGFKVVFSSENVIKTAIVEVENEQNKKSTIGSISYMPAIFGIYIASEIIREFIDI